MTKKGSEARQTSFDDYDRILPASPMYLVPAGQSERVQKYRSHMDSLAVSAGIDMEFNGGEVTFTVPSSKVEGVMRSLNDMRLPSRAISKTQRQTPDGVTVVDFRVKID